MKELFRTHDPVLLSWATALLKEAGIEAIIFDEHMGIVQGSLGVIEKRLMVADQDFYAAQTLIRERDENNT